jgi:hypothetical protein
LLVPVSQTRALGLQFVRGAFADLGLSSEKLLQVIPADVGCGVAIAIRTIHANGDQPVQNSGGAHFHLPPLFWILTGVLRLTRSSPYEASRVPAKHPLIMRLFSQQNLAP